MFCERREEVGEEVKGEGGADEKEVEELLLFTEQMEKAKAMVVNISVEGAPPPLTTKWISSPVLQHSISTATTTTLPPAPATAAETTGEQPQARRQR